MPQNMVSHNDDDDTHYHKKNAKGFLGVMLFKLKTKILYMEEVKEVLIA